MKKPILITGSHRSGSTWVGKMIAISPLVAYIHEPFNVDYPPSTGICGAKFDRWFTYISPENEADCYKQIKNTINFSYNLTGELKEIKTRKELSRVLTEYKTFFKYRFSQVRPLFKDPIAVLSAEWLASKFNMDVVVLIRHPAAFAGSLKVKNWTFPFAHFLRQPLLMKNHLYPFEAEIKSYVEKERDIIDQAALLWKIIHYRILQYQKNNKNWMFVRHEDLSKNPLSGFQTLFNYLELEFSENLQNAIKEYSNVKDYSDHQKNITDSIKRDSLSNIRNWQNRLNESEIERIRTKVEDISIKFYSDEDWL